MQKKEIRSFYTTCKKINSKWIKGLNVTPKTTRLLEKNGKKLLIGLRNDFWKSLLKHKQENRKQVEVHQSKKFLHSKRNHQQNKKAS